MQEKWEKCFIKYLIIKVLLFVGLGRVSKKKSQYPADSAEYCDFTFFSFYTSLLDTLFYRLQYVVEYLVGMAEGDEIAFKLRWTYVDATV